MTGYLLNFTVYTAAMIGIIFLALYVYKKVALGIGSTSKSKFLGVEDTINLAPRKNLYVIRAGEERFLVASDVDKTVLISKLGENVQSPHLLNTYVNEQATNPSPISRRQPTSCSVDELPTIVDFPKKNKARNKTVFENIVSGINEN